MDQTTERTYKEIVLRSTALPGGGAAVELEFECQCGTRNIIAPVHSRTVRCMCGVQHDLTGFFRMAGIKPAGPVEFKVHLDGVEISQQLAMRQRLRGR